jgi:hypothetical protein
MSVTAPRISRNVPTSDRTTAGDSPSETFGTGSAPLRRRAWERGRRAEVVARDVERRRWAIR